MVDVVAQQSTVIGTLGTAVSVGASLLSVALVVITWAVRRQGREAKEARLLRDTNLAALRWHYKISTLAALRGWDTDPQWPDTPRELTAEFLTGAAEQDPAGGIVQLAEAVEKLREGKS